MGVRPALLAVVLLAALAAGCATPATGPSTPAALEPGSLPVIVLESTFAITEADNGTAWSPPAPSPWYHCMADDIITLDRSARTVTVPYYYIGGQGDAAFRQFKQNATVVLLSQERGPDQPHSPRHYALDLSTPAAATTLALGNDATSGHATLGFAAGIVTLDGVAVAPGDARAFHFSYVWHHGQNDGTDLALDVDETLTVRNLGVWPDPLRGVDGNPPDCLSVT
ncbi:MAG: hypothetical protein V4510_02860 [bacterium]